MRGFSLIICVLLLAAFGIKAQHKKYLIWLSDKNQTGFSLSEPESFLSERAIQHRWNQGIAIDSLDLPVVKAYIDAVKAVGVDIRCTSKWLNTLTVMTDDTSHIDAIKKLAFVDSVNLTWIEPEEKSAKMKFETLMPLDYDYGLSDTQIAIHRGQEMHMRGFTGKGILIAVLDAGFKDVDVLPAFDSLWFNNQIISHKDFVDPQSNIFDEHYHGMAVLSIMGGHVPGSLVGSAPDASYILIRTEDANSEYPVEMDYWIAGAEYADSIGADLINSSLGYSVFDDAAMNYSHSDLNGWNIRVTRGADIAVSKGILVVTSAGNEGNKLWQKITGPADGKAVLGVGSVNKDSTYTAFSSRGSTADGRVKPDVMSNGYRTIIQRSNGLVGNGSGTSFSSPVMTGMAACLWQAVPRLSAAELRDVIIRSSDRFMAPSDSFGYGIPNIYKAYLNSGSQPWDSNPNMIYPSLVRNDFVYVREPYDHRFTQLNIYDLYGHLVKVMPLNGAIVERVDFPPGLASGIYILKIIGYWELRDYDGENIIATEPISFTQRIIKL